VILDDYQDAVRKLRCASKLDAYAAKVYTNTVKGIGQLSVRLKDADVIVLIRERTQISRQLVEKLPKLKLISQTGRVGSHIDVNACSELGVAVQGGVDVAVGHGYSVSLDAKKYWVSTEATFYAPVPGGVALQTKHKLDPWVLSAGLAYRF